MGILLLLIFPLMLGLWAQFRVGSTYRKYSKVRSKSGITGREAAAYVLEKAGISDVKIRSCRGHLTDHYDPSKRLLFLSAENYQGKSLAALGIAAHEAGHAIQHKIGYGMLNFRMALIPITMISSKFLPLVIIGGFMFKMMGLIYLGIGVYSILTIFQLVTLPVEFDASRRAKAELADLGIIEPHEGECVEQMLDAAGWTYVAAFVSSLANLLWLISAARR